MDIDIKFNYQQYVINVKRLFYSNLKIIKYEWNNIIKVNEYVKNTINLVFILNVTF